jgi:ABC-type glutathione transport system ATPase component
VSAAVLQLRDVAVGLSSHAWLGQPITAVVHEGDWVFVTGRSGAGKSVLLQTIMGLLPSPWRVRGEVLITTPTGPCAIQRNHRGRVVAWLPQACGPALHPLRRVRHQLDAPRQWHGLPPRHRDEQGQRDGQLNRLGVESLLDRYPHQLSGGQQQRVLFAQLLSAAPRLLLLDEPTASLDDDNRDILLAELDQLRTTGVAIVMVSHDLRLWPRANRSWLIDNHVLIEDNPQSPASEIGRLLLAAST